MAFEYSPDWLKSFVSSSDCWRIAGGGRRGGSQGRVACLALYFSQQGGHRHSSSREPSAAFDRVNRQPNSLLMSV
jgi:hypothetical protein